MQRVKGLGRVLLVASGSLSRSYPRGPRHNSGSFQHLLTAAQGRSCISSRVFNLDCTPSTETPIQLVGAQEFYKRLSLKSRAKPTPRASGHQSATELIPPHNDGKKRSDPVSAVRLSEKEHELRRTTSIFGKKFAETPSAANETLDPTQMAGAVGTNGVPVVEPDPALDTSSPSEAEADSPAPASGTPPSSSIPILDASAALRTQQPPKKSKPPHKKPEKRKYLKPSAASGGVPKPKLAYLQQAQLPPTLLPSPRRILVVIDLNGTLLYRPNRRKSQNFVERPYARTFLDYCIRTFAVAIWSSARPANVALMLNQLVSPEQRRRLVAVWGRDTLGLSPEDYQERVQVYKRLEVLWAEERKKGREWNQTNTVLVDDSKEKARTEPHNIVQLPEFDGDRQGDEGKYVLPQVHDYLNECARQGDVSCFIRTQPFVLREGFRLG